VLLIVVPCILCIPAVVLVAWLLLSTVEMANLVQYIYIYIYISGRRLKFYCLWVPMELTPMTCKMYSIFGLCLWDWCGAVLLSYQVWRNSGTEIFPVLADPRSRRATTPWHWYDSVYSKVCFPVFPSDVSTMVGRWRYKSCWVQRGEEWGRDRNGP
jgi:hypothetical protein